MEEYKTINLMMVILYKNYLSYFEVCMYACTHAHTHTHTHTQIFKWFESVGVGRVELM